MFLFFLIWLILFILNTHFSIVANQKTNTESLKYLQKVLLKILS